LSRPFPLILAGRVDPVPPGFFYKPVSTSCTGLIPWRTTSMRAISASSKSARNSTSRNCSNPF